MPTYGRVLFFGIGGGNDIFSTTLAMASLWKLGWRWNECALAGIISPFHRHTVTKTNIPGVYETSPDSKRLLLRKDAEKEIGFVDSKVSEMVSVENIYGANRVFALSLKHGTIGLRKSLRGLSKIYDFIVLVDLGGDFFYSGHADWHIISPLFDSIVIRAVQGSGVSSILFEAGPGTDGEIDPEALNGALGKYATGSYSLDPEIMGWWEALYSKWIKSYRPGRTNEMTIQAFHSQERFITVPYRVRAHLVDRVDERFYKYFDQRIDTELCRHFYLINPQEIKNPFLVTCKSAKEWFYKTQVAKWHTNNEANLEYWEEKGGLLQFLTPSPLLDQGDRLVLLKKGLEHLAQGLIHAVWIFPKDFVDCGESVVDRKFEIRDLNGILEVRKK